MTLTTTHSARRVCIRMGPDGADHGGGDADLRVRLRERALDARVPQHLVLRDDHVRAHFCRRTDFLCVAHHQALPLAHERPRDGGVRYPGTFRVRAVLSGWSGRLMSGDISWR